MDLASLGLLGEAAAEADWFVQRHPGDAGADSLLHDRSLELGEHAHHLKQRLACRRGCIEALLVQVQINALAVQLAEQPDEILQRSAETIHRPSHH